MYTLIQYICFCIDVILISYIYNTTLLYNSGYKTLLYKCAKLINCFPK